jgi:murein DD-endopeptidase MepM/ murein hydrolase activator NlpD
VTQNYLDELGNTTLVIENDQYRVTLLHGDYTVEVGEKVRQGQTIGRESNNGFTTDLQGRPCAGRDCGYHTHLNVFDIEQNGNIDPLTLLSP